MSTISRSPASAPWTSIGPLSMWQIDRSTSRTSLAESLLPSCASVHSRHSTRKSLPGDTDAAGGMSGCQRLWPGTAWSAMDFDWTTLKTTSGIDVLPLELGGRAARRRRATGLANFGRDGQAARDQLVRGASEGLARRPRLVRRALRAGLDSPRAAGKTLRRR